MRNRIVLASGAVALAVSAFVAGAAAQEAAHAIGAYPSHVRETKFDLSVGVTANQVPRRAVRMTEVRDVLHVPSHFGSLVSVTQQADTAILWYADAAGAVRNVVVPDAARRPVEVDLSESSRVEIELRER